MTARYSVGYISKNKKLNDFRNNIQNKHCWAKKQSTNKRKPKRTFTFFSCKIKPLINVRMRPKRNQGRWNHPNCENKQATAKFKRGTRVVRAFHKFIKIQLPFLPEFVQESDHFQSMVCKNFQAN